LHNGPLEVGKVTERQAKLDQYGMQSTRFEFVLGIADNGEPTTVVQGSMDPLPMFVDKHHTDFMAAFELADLAD